MLPVTPAKLISDQDRVRRRPHHHDESFRVRRTGEKGEGKPLTARIDVADGAAGASIRVSGRLDEATARELVTLCSHKAGVRLDLGELLSADRAAVEALRGLQADGAHIVGASHYIAMLLGTTPVDPATTDLETTKEER